MLPALLEKLKALEPVFDRVDQLEVPITSLIFILFKNSINFSKLFILSLTRPSLKDSVNELMAWSQHWIAPSRRCVLPVQRPRRPFATSSAASPAEPLPRLHKLQQFVFSMCLNARVKLLTVLRNSGMWCVSWLSSSLVHRVRVGSRCLATTCSQPTISSASRRWRTRRASRLRLQLQTQQRSLPTHPRKGAKPQQQQQKWKQQLLRRALTAPTATLTTLILHSARPLKHDDSLYEYNSYLYTLYL